MLQHLVALPAGVALSQQACAAACCDGGYGLDPSTPDASPVAGVEFGQDCFCDRPFTPALARAHRTDAAECAAKTCGSGNEPCGGANHVLVYEYSCSSNCSFVPPPEPPAKPLVPPAVFAVMAGNGSAGSAAATGIIGGCGHQLGGNGTFKIPSSPWLTAQVAAAHGANLTWTPLVAGCTLEQLRQLIFFPARVDAFVTAMVKDAVENDYDGINFDLEMGGFGAREEGAYAEMLVKLQVALTEARGPHRPLAPVSACVGSAKNGLASPEGVQAAPAGSALLYDMGTYTSSTLSFSKELLSALER
eukprot:SAG31_NODE_10132_length_1179_cov_1.378704_1_plen_304_part_00